MYTTLPVRRSFDMFLTPNILIVFGAIVLNVLFYIIYLVIPDKTSFVDAISLILDAELFIAK